HSGRARIVLAIRPRSGFAHWAETRTPLLGKSLGKLSKRGALPRTSSRQLVRGVTGRWARTCSGQMAGFGRSARRPGPSDARFISSSNILTSDEFAFSLRDE